MAIAEQVIFFHFHSDILLVLFDHISLRAGQMGKQ